MKKSGRPACMEVEGRMTSLFLGLSHGSVSFEGAEVKLYSSLCNGCLGNIGDSLVNI